MRRLIPLLAGFTLVATAAAAQGLGEAAQREQERRKKSGTPGKVYTDDDLKQGVRPGAPGAKPRGDAAAGRTAEAGDESALHEQAQKYWRGRFADARGAVRKAEDGVAAAQARVEAARNPMRAPSGSARPPTAADATKYDPFDQRNTGGDELAKAEAALAKAQQDLEKARKTLADLEEEARKKGVPPGWQRE